MSTYFIFIWYNTVHKVFLVDGLLVFGWNQIFSLSVSVNHIIFQVMTMPATKKNKMYHDTKCHIQQIW